jgi:hypothetical protein
MFLLSAVTTALIAAVAAAASDVVVLTSENFEKEVGPTCFILSPISIINFNMVTDPGLHWRHHWGLAS